VIDLASGRFIELEFVALAIVEGRDSSPIVLGDSRRKLHTSSLEVINCVLQVTLQAKGYYWATADLGTLRLPTVKPDVEPVGVDLGPWTVTLD
jgi:hypothetical protein